MQVKFDSRQSRRFGFVSTIRVISIYALTGLMLKYRICCDWGENQEVLFCRRPVLTFRFKRILVFIDIFNIINQVTVSNALGKREVLMPSVHL